MIQREFIQKTSLKKVLLIATIVYYDIADCIIIMYDVTKPKTFHSVDNWLNSLRHLSVKEKELFLVGCKTDKIKERKVSSKLGQKLAEKKKIHYFEISITDKKITNGLLDIITNIIVKKKLNFPIEESTTIVLPKKSYNSCFII